MIDLKINNSKEMQAEYQRMNGEFYKELLGWVRSEEENKLYSDLLRKWKKLDLLLSELSQQEQCEWAAHIFLKIKQLFTAQTNRTTDQLFQKLYLLCKSAQKFKLPLQHRQLHHIIKQTYYDLYKDKIIPVFRKSKFDTQQFQVAISFQQNKGFLVSGSLVFQIVEDNNLMNANFLNIENCQIPILLFLFVNNQYFMNSFFIFCNVFFFTNRVYINQNLTIGLSSLNFNYKFIIFLPKNSCQNKASHIMKHLKFKEIRNSIISKKQSSINQTFQNEAPLRKNLFGQPQDATEMSFKIIKQNITSPLKPTDPNLQNISQFSTNKKTKFLFEESSAERQNLSPLSNKKKLLEIEKSKGISHFDSQKKAFKYQRITQYFGSDQKQNCQRSIYLGKENKENYNFEGGSNLVKGKKLNTGRQNYNDTSYRLDIQINPMYETSKNPNPGSLTKRNSSGMLFKTALETSNKKKTLRNNLDSERSNGRQSSIGRLKQKLFGMKKLISQKEIRPPNNPNQEEEQTRSFSIYTDSAINTKTSTLINQKEGEKKNCLTTRRQESENKNDENMSFSNLVFGSINKGLHKKVFKNFMNEEKHETTPSTIPMMNQSRLDSVNISLAQSYDSILDMSPNI